MTFVTFANGKVSRVEETYAGLGGSKQCPQSKPRSGSHQAIQNRPRLAKAGSRKSQQLQRRTSLKWQLKWESTASAVSGEMCFGPDWIIPSIEFVAANDLTDTKTLAHLLKYDSMLGPLHADVKAEGDSITVDGKAIKIFATKDPAADRLAVARRCRSSSNPQVISPTRRRPRPTCAAA